MYEILNKLLTVKSLVTLALTIVFCVLSVVGAITGDQFLTIFTVVIGFYFGTQYEKKQKPVIAEAIPLETIEMAVSETEKA